MKKITSVAFPIDLNEFVGNNYWALYTLFPESTCSELTTAFGNALKEWAKSKKIKTDVINAFYSYCARIPLVKEAAMETGYFHGTSIRITLIKTGGYDPSQYLWVFGEIGSYLILNNSRFSGFQELRIRVLFLRGYKYEDISVLEGVSIAKLEKISIKLGLILIEAGYRHASTISNFEKIVQGRLRNDYPGICFVFNDWITIGNELDIFIPDMRLAFEINGIAHYKPIYGMERLLRSQMLDKKKKGLCKEHEIHLIEINVSDVKKKWTENHKEHHYNYIKEVLHSKISGKLATESIQQEEPRPMVASDSEKEKLFLELISGIDTKKDEKQYPNSTFYFNENKILFELHKSEYSTDIYLWCSFLLFSQYDKQFDMEREETISFLTKMIKKHLKLKNFELSTLRSDRLQRWKRIESENHKNLPDKERLFLELIPNLAIKTDQKKFPGSVFYFKTNSKGTRLVMEYNAKTEYLLCSYNLFWTKFYSEFFMSDVEINSFVKAMAKKYLQLKSCDPCWWSLNYDVGNRVKEVEQHFTR